MSPSETTYETPTWQGYWIAAWLISACVHLTATIVLLTLAQKPQKGAGGTADDMGIVLDAQFDTPAPLWEETPIPPTENFSVAQSEAGSPAKLEASPLETQPSESGPIALQISPTAKSSIFDSPGNGEGHILEGPGRFEGDRAHVRVFGLEGVGNKFVYLFDRSTSMEGPPLAAAKQQLLASLDSLESVHQFQIIYFNNDLRIFTPPGPQRIPFATEQNKNAARTFVGQIQAVGGTERLPALLHAVALAPDVIFFLTDADDPMPTYELAQLSSRNRYGKTSIHVIEFGIGSPRRSENFLVRLARDSGGQYVYVDTTRFAR
jgi:hypothetical protein